MITNLITRFRNLPAPALEESLRLEQGSLRDYAALSLHHYKARRPATALRVWTLTHRQVGVVGRFLGRKEERQVAGVLVESLPSLGCRMRDYALHNRYGGIKDMRLRARLLNAEVRCLSRVVVHPQWRGLGLAVRLVQAALAQPQTIYTEALAAMGRVHPFFAQAGMTAYPRPAHECDARLAAALQTVGIKPVDLAHLENVGRRIANLPAPQRQWLLRELARWHRRHRGRDRRYDPDPSRQLRTAQSRLLCAPIYYLRRNS